MAGACAHLSGRTLVAWGGVVVHFTAAMFSQAPQMGVLPLKTRVFFYGLGVLAPEPGVGTRPPGPCLTLVAGLPCRFTASTLGQGPHRDLTHFFQGLAVPPGPWIPPSVQAVTGPSWLNPVVPSP